MLIRRDLYERIANLSPRQRSGLAQSLQKLKLDHKLKSLQSIEHAVDFPQRLVAYVVLNPSFQFDPSGLRSSLVAKLPAHMVPTAIVPLTAMPRTPNGKLDTDALPKASPLASYSDRDTTPRTWVEKTLTQIWCDVLRLDAIGIHDNFFELGGDSILSIQIVSKAREAGFQFAPNQLFEHSTIAELAAVVNLATDETIDQTTVIGPVSLTPIQNWFFEQQMIAPNHWNQAILFELPPNIDGAAIEKAIAMLWDHHDALRLRFNHADNSWQQTNEAAGTSPSLYSFDLSTLTDDEQRQAVTDHSNNLHADLSFASGQLMRAAHFTRGAVQPSWLLISLHHLVVDAVSWQILHGDLNILLCPWGQKKLSDLSTSLPAKTTSFQAWAKILASQASQRQSEAALWLEQVESPVMRLPEDCSSVSPSTEATAQTVTVVLEETDTHALLQSVPAVYNTQINDVLLTALSQTLLQWGGTDAGAVQLEVEAHGRETIVPSVDLSRTVGWLTTTYPIRLQLADSNDYTASLKSVKEQLRKVPDRGIGYGLLRYLGEESIRQRLAQARSSNILFNYLGQQNSSRWGSGNYLDQNNRITIRQDIDLGQLRDPRNCRSYRLEVNAWVVREQLQIRWTYDTQIYRPTTINQIATTYLSKLKAIIAHCTTSASSGFTPSDFPDAEFNQTDLDNFINLLTQES